MNLQPNIPNQIHHQSINIETPYNAPGQQAVASGCNLFTSSIATLASAVGGILGIAAAALQVKNPDSESGSSTQNIAIAAVVGNIMALVGTGIAPDGQRDIGAGPLLAQSLGILIGVPATVTNALSFVDLTNNSEMSVNKAHYALTTAALALTGLASLLNIGRIMTRRPD
jgi:hypothetical protein